MKKFIKKITRTAKSTVTRVKTAAANSMSAVHAFNRRAVCGNAGEGYIDTAVKVLIAVVLGALVLESRYGRRPHFDHQCRNTCSRDLTGGFDQPSTCIEHHPLWEGQ